MPAVRDEPTGQPRGIECAPKDVVGAVERGGAAIAEMREANWAGGSHPAKNVCRGISVSDGDVDAQFARSGKALQCSVDLGGHCEEQGIVPGEGAKFSDSLLCGL